jgi:hypothetical protein
LLMQIWGRISLTTFTLVFSCILQSYQNINVCYLCNGLYLLLV